MRKLTSVVTLRRIGGVVIACWLGSPTHVMAQAPRTLVVVTDASDEDSVRRIGDKLVEVEILLAVKTGPQPESYELCNNRVKDLLEFGFLFYREDTERTADRFWRQRLTMANPKGIVCHLSQSRLGLEVEERAERAKVIHQALSSKFPDQREQLDANLQAELHRLYWLSTRPLQFALLN